MATDFIHLHCHSNYSFHDGASSIDGLLETAVRKGMSALALTDRNNVSGSVEFYEKARLRGIKPVIGAEILMSDKTPLVLLAKNRQGYENLCSLLSTVHMRSRHGNFNCILKDLAACRDGLILLSGGPDSTLTKLVKQKKIAEAAELCRKLREVFGENLYIEIAQLREEHILLNYKLADLAQSTGISLVATNDVYHAEKSDHPVRAILRAVGKLTTVTRLAEPGSDEQYLKTPEEMQKMLKRYPEALANSVKIAEECNFDYTLGTQIFPKLGFPDGETAYSALWKASFEGIRKKYRPLSREAMTRLEYELDIINRKGFAEYFLIAQDIVRYCRSQRIPCVGRGSAGDSLVSYVLGITPADPIYHNLYFERFLNPERSEPPDIDLDICWKQRDTVLDYIYERYGHEKTAMICTYNTYQLRSAIADIGKAFGLPEDEVRKITRTLPHRAVDYLKKAVKDIPECRDHPVMQQAYRQIVKISERIAGFPKHLSVHPGGVIIAPDRITNYTALEESAKGLIISQHDMHAIEKLGLVKMDILGVRGLSVIADCIEISGFERMEDIPENDAETMKMIMRGATMGVFQLESPAMRGLLKKMQVQTVEDVIAAVAIIRPGPAEGGMKDAFIRRRAGAEKTTYPHPLLQPVLKETYGIIVYQEQVLQVARAIAGFSYSEADLLRRSMTKARTRETVRPIQEKFMLGAINNGLTENAARKVWQYLENFVGYGFNKAHSATYGMLAYRSAYLKHRNPVEFMKSVLNNGGGFYSLCAYVEETRRLGITLEPPDVNAAERLFICDGNRIISGLYPVYGLTRKSMKRITEERKQEPYTNLFDFLRRTRMMEKEALALAKIGAMRSLHPSEPETLAMIKMYYRNNRNENVTKRLTENLSLPPYTLHQRILAEMEILRFAVSAHPLTLFPDVDLDNTLIASRELGEHPDETVSVAGWMVTARRTPTKDGKYLKFATIEDKHGLMEAVLFPEVYAKYGKLLHGFGPFKLTGTVQSRVKGEANLIVESVRKITSPLLTKRDYKLFDRDLNDPLYFDAA